MSYFEDIIDRTNRELGRVFLRNPSDTANMGDAATPLVVQDTNLNQTGTTQTIRLDAVLTGSYVPSIAVDLRNYRQVGFNVMVGTPQAGVNAKIKVQKSWDNITYYDEQSAVVSDRSNGEETQQLFSQVKLLDMSGLSYWSPIFDKSGSFMRLAIASDSGLTTGTISATATPIDR